MASKCALCVRARAFSFGNILSSTNRSKATLVRKFCFKAKVPNDVTNSTANSFSGERYAVFERDDVQHLLKKLTGLNLNKIFGSRKEDLCNPVYKVLDEKELQEDEKQINTKAEQLLQMPPVMTRRKPIKSILSTDADIIGHDEDSANYVFTDISPSKDDRSRAINVRENDSGVLREATWDERDRMQFMYWPKEGQLHEVPAMLQGEGLIRLFDDLRHVDALDLINIQCEPDAPDYIRVCHRVYDDIESRQRYDILHSTRHFGPMVFYYVINKKTNKLLGYFLRNDSFSDGVDLVKLHHLVHDETETSQEDIDDMKLLQNYLTDNGLHDLLELVKDKEQMTISQTA